jgi:tetratricopeptide (TPR) repeat protein
LGAGRTLEAALARGLDEAPIYAALADIYEQSRHIENAIPAMRLAIQRDPENEAYRFRYAMLLTDTKAPAAAVIRLQEALEKFPSSPRLWFALGVAYSALHKSAEATEAFTRTLQLDPKFAPALAYLGTAYDEEGKYAEAIAHYERALAIDEKLVIVHHLLGEVMLKQSPNDTARAETHFSQAAQLDPTFAPCPIVARENLRAHQSFERSGRASLSVLLRSTKISPKPITNSADYTCALNVRTRRRRRLPPSNG